MQQQFFKASVLATVSLLSISLFSAAPVVAQDKLSKFLLIKLSREQSVALCSSDAFTECMGFSSKQCFELSEQAVEECLQPLPDQVDIKELQNETIESCPRMIYENAGYPEDKAQACLQEAMIDLQGNTAPQSAPEEAPAVKDKGNEG